MPTNGMMASLTSLSLETLPTSLSSLRVLLAADSHTHTCSRDTLSSPRSFVSFVSANGLVHENNTFSPSAGSKTGVLKENKPSSLSEASLLNREHCSLAKNRDAFFVGDNGVNSIWQRDCDSSKTTVGGQLNSNQLTSYAANHGSLPQPPQQGIQTNSTSRTVDPGGKRILPSPKPVGSARCKRAKRRLRQWTEKEDRKLEEGVKLYGLRNWVLVAKHVTTRDNKMCRQRWSMNVKPEIKVVKKGKWLEEEDQQIRQIVSKHGKEASTWELVSKAMGYNRNIKQIKGRYENFLDPTLKHGPWTEEEDNKLLRLQSESGNKWKTFESTLVGRSSERIRRRFSWLSKRRSKNMLCSK